jgi:hypothetical protein
MSEQCCQTQDGCCQYPGPYLLYRHFDEYHAVGPFATSHEAHAYRAGVEKAENENLTILGVAYGLDGFDMFTFYDPRHLELPSRKEPEA